MFDGIVADMTEEERRGRIDIGYRSTAGKHIIIELKRPEIRVSLWALTAQIEKYRSGLTKLLESMGKHRPTIEIVVLLGSHPREWNNPNGHQIVEDSLAVQGARCVLYKELLEHAYEAYQDYDNRRRDVVDELQSIIREIEDYAPALSRSFDMAVFRGTAGLIVMPRTIVPWFVPDGRIVNPPSPMQTMPLPDRHRIKVAVPIGTVNLSRSR